MRELITPEQRALFPGAIKEISDSLVEKISNDSGLIHAKDSFLSHGLELTVQFLREANQRYQGTEYDEGHWLLGLNNAARSGFYASSQVMNLSVPAYIEYCDSVDSDLDPKEFSEILVRQKSFQNVLLFLATMHVDKNSAYEYYLGLRQDNHSLTPGMGNYGENSFCIKADEGVTTLDFNPYVIQEVEREPDVLKQPDIKGRRCPAVFSGSLERLWRLQVETSQTLGVTSTVLAGVTADALQR